MNTEGNSMTLRLLAGVKWSTPLLILAIKMHYCRLFFSSPVNSHQQSRHWCFMYSVDYSDNTLLPWPFQHSVIFSAEPGTLLCFQHHWCLQKAHRTNKHTKPFKGNLQRWGGGGGGCGGSPSQPCHPSKEMGMLSFSLILSVWKWNSGENNVVLRSREKGSH